MEVLHASPAVNGTAESREHPGSPETEAAEPEAAAAEPAEAAAVGEAAAADAHAGEAAVAAQPEAAAAPPRAAAPPAGAVAAEQPDEAGTGRPGQHLLKHAVSPEVRAAAVAEFGEVQVEAGAAICRLRQPLLRAMFTKVFGVETTSGNNDWMRGKLLQAVGLGNRWRPPADPAQAAQAQAQQEEAGGRTMRQRHVPARLQSSSGEEEEEEEEDDDEEARVVARRRKRGRAPLAAPAEKRGRPAPAPSPRSGCSQLQQAAQPQSQQTQDMRAAQQQQQRQEQQPTVVVMLPGGQVQTFGAEQLAWQHQATQQAQQAQQLQQELQQQAQRQQLLQQAAAAQLLQQQPFGFGGARGFGAPPSPDLQRLLVLQQMAQGGGGAMEHAALHALHALGLLPPAGGLGSGLHPALQPQLAASNPLLPAGQPPLLPPASSPWPLMLGPGFDEQQAAVAAAALASAQQRQRQQPGGQLWQQQLEEQQQRLQQAQQQAQQLEQQQQQQQQQQEQLEAGVPVGPPASAPRPVAAAPVKSVAAVPFSAPSPFAEQAAVPLSSSWTTHLQQQQQVGELMAGEQAQPAQQQAQHPQQPGQAAEQPHAQQAYVGGGVHAAAALASAAFGSREGSLVADLKALEALGRSGFGGPGWSASLASLPTLSADLHALFNAWQEGRVSLSLAPDLKPAP